MVKLQRQSYLILYALALGFLEALCAIILFPYVQTTVFSAFVVFCYSLLQGMLTLVVRDIMHGKDKHKIK